MLEVHGKPTSIWPSDFVVGGINLALYPDPSESIKQTLLNALGDRELREAEPEEACSYTANPT